MADVSSATKFWPTAQQGFTTTTSGSVSSAAATVGLNSVSGYSNGDVVTLVIDPTDTTKKQVFTGTVDTSGVQITGVVWTEGTNQAHSAGATVVDYETATAWALQAKGFLVQHTQAGLHGAITATSLTTSAGLTVSGGSVTLPSASISQAALPLGAVVQIVGATTSSVATGTTVIPYDDTIPQITEGDEYMTQAITPKSATNRLSIEAVIHLSNTASDHLIAALFQDATANALAAAWQYQLTNQAVVNLKLTHDMVAGTTSSTTFRIRGGNAAAGTTTLNGLAGGRKFGTVASSSMKITEYKA